MSARIRAQQVNSWVIYGGDALLARLFPVGNGYLALLRRGKGSVSSSAVHPFCAGFDQLARDASAYFQVPDPQGLSLWRTYIAETRTIGQDCDRATAHNNGDLLPPAGTQVEQRRLSDYDALLGLDRVA